MMRSMQPDAETIAALEPLIPPMRRYARALLRKPEDADDLVQDVLERALARWQQHRRAASLRAWLFAILHNLAIDRLRQRKRRGRPESIETVEDARLATPPEQASGIEQGDIMALVASLPEDQRAVLLLIGVEDLTYAEAAAVLDVPLGTVMSRLSRARERLRRMMETGERAVPRPDLGPDLRIVR